MTEINIETFIETHLERCFDLSRSIDLHVDSSVHTREKAIEGRNEGLIELNETVRWEAVHFHFKLFLTVKVTKFDRPNFFVDEMIKGNFKKMKHEHYFSQSNDHTIMKDIFSYEVPCGLIGRAIDKLVLKSYLEKFLLERNKLIKEAAESEEWKKYLKKTKTH